jgi:hypothetical protein
MSTQGDPERLAEAKPRSQLGEVFASASRELPSADQLARLAAQLGPVLDGAPGAPPAPSGASTLVKLGVATAALSLLVGVGLTLGRPSRPASVSVTTAPTATGPSVTAPTSVALPAPSAPASPSRPAEPATQAEPSASAPSSKSSQAPNKPASEAALLEQARRALSSSPNYALQLANQHRARFPNGVLSQEREVIAIEALRRLHRVSDADQRAGAFSKAFPGSAHQRMVDEVAPK